MWSKVLGALEKFVSAAPLLGLILYYYIDRVRAALTPTQKYVFWLAAALFVFVCVYKTVTKKHIEELRQATVHAETEAKLSDGERKARAVEEGAKARRKLTLYDRLGYLSTLLIFGITVYILERALIGISTLIVTAAASLTASTVLKLLKIHVEKKEKLK